MIKQSIKRLIILAKMITLILLVFMTAYVGTDLFAGREACAAQPHFETINGHEVLMVNDKPFLLLGVEGEGAASSSNQSEILNNLDWAGNNNCNVFKACVSWRWMEPSKDSYSFTFLDQVISKARSYNI